MLSIRISFACVCLSFMAIGCEHNGMEGRFFDKPAEDRLSRLRQYSLEDQYKIYRYGNDKIEPPFTDLAAPIAERGAAAIPFLLGQLNSTADDLTVRDVLFIFQTMASSKSYDVKADQALMALLTSKVSGMNDTNWRQVCLQMLQRFRGNP